MPAFPISNGLFILLHSRAKSTAQTRILAAKPIFYDFFEKTHTNFAIFAGKRRFAAKSAQNPDEIRQNAAKCRFEKDFCARERRIAPKASRIKRHIENDFCKIDEKMYRTRD